MQSIFLLLGFLRAVNEAFTNFKMIDQAEFYTLDVKNKVSRCVSVGEE